jgi:hypothetical protein
MKTILLAALALAAVAAPVQAAKKPFKVVTVTITTLDGKTPDGAPKFKKGDTIKLNIKPKKLTGPEEISIPHARTTASEIIYSLIDGKKGKSDVATVTKVSGKINRVELVFTRRVASPIPGVTMPGLVTYTLIPK